MTNIDYSDRAVTTRVKRLSDLRNFCLMLAKTKPYSKPASDTQAPVKRQP